MERKCLCKKYGPKAGERIVDYRMAHKLELLNILYNSRL